MKERDDRDGIPDGSAVETIVPANKLEAVVYTINTILHYIAGIVLMLMLLITIADVIGRKFFHSPLEGAIELTEVGLVLTIYLALGYAQHFGDHVTIDLLYEALPERGRKVLAVIGSAIAATIGLFLAWRLYLYSDVLGAGGYQTPTYHIPLQYIALLAAFGAVMFVAAMLVDVWKTVTSHSSTHGPDHETSGLV